MFVDCVGAITIAVPEYVRQLTHVLSIDVSSFDLAFLVARNFINEKNGFDRNSRVYNQPTVRIRIDTREGGRMSLKHWKDPINFPGLRPGVHFANGDAGA